MIRKVNPIDRFTGKPVHENAIFHQFGLEATETGGSFSVAIIELPSGIVVVWDVNHIQFVNDQTERPGNDDQYYLQDSRDLVGNDMLFWQLGGGYTTDVNRAEIFTKDSALKQHRDRRLAMVQKKVSIDFIPTHYQELSPDPES